MIYETSKDTYSNWFRIRSQLFNNQNFALSVQNTLRIWRPSSTVHGAFTDNYSGSQHSTSRPNFNLSIFTGYKNTISGNQKNFVVKNLLNLKMYQLIIQLHRDSIDPLKQHLYVPQHSFQSCRFDLLYEIGHLRQLIK